MNCKMKITAETVSQKNFLTLTPINKVKQSERMDENINRVDISFIAVANR